MWREHQMLLEPLEFDKLTWYGVDGPWVWISTSYGRTYHHTSRRKWPPDGG